MYYFDYAATTPLSTSALQTMNQQLNDGWFNPSAQYDGGVDVQKQIKEWRSILAHTLSCDPSEFYFTSGGTEGNNWAITQGVTLGRHHGKHCITSTVEHSSVLKSMKNLEQQGYQVTYLKPNPQGEITPDMVREAVREDTVFLSLMMVNNETGMIFPVEEIAVQVKKVNPRVVVHCDGVQAYLKVPFTLSGGEKNNRLLNIDLLSISGHKVYAPKGVGGLFIRKGVKLPPLFHGGGQEQGLRSGTEPTHQMAAFATAAQEGFSQFLPRMETISQRKQETIHGLSSLSSVKIHEFDTLLSAPHILSFSVVGYPSQVVLRYLNEKGIYVSAGSACHRGGDSHVFSTLPLSKKERMGALRLSFSHHTTQEEVTALVQGVASAVKELIPSF